MNHLLRRTLEYCLSAGLMIAVLNSSVVFSADSGLDRLRGNADQVQLDGTTLSFHFRDKLPKSGELVFPRLNARLEAVHWLGHPDSKLTLRPDPNVWRIKLDNLPAEQRVVVVKLLDPIVPDRGVETIVVDSGADTVSLPAHFAVTHGEKLRFEPQPHKNTIGYWTVPTDWAAWALEVKAGGTFGVDILQGCGTNQGGSLVEVRISQADQVIDQISFEVEETGHFQNFKQRRIGTLSLPDSGKYQLEIRPQKLANKAVMDVREVKLVPIHAK